MSQHVPACLPYVHSTTQCSRYCRSKLGHHYLENSKPMRTVILNILTMCCSLDLPVPLDSVQHTSSFHNTFHHACDMFKPAIEQQYNKQYYDVLLIGRPGIGLRATHIFTSQHVPPCVRYIQTSITAAIYDSITMCYSLDVLVLDLRGHRSPFAHLFSAFQQTFQQTFQHPFQQIFQQPSSHVVAAVVGKTLSV